MNSSQMTFSSIILSLFHNCLNHGCTTFKGLIIFVFRITYLYSLDGLFFFSRIVVDIEDWDFYNR